MRRLVIVTVAWQLQLTMLHVPAAAAPLHDRLLAVVDTTTVAASDIALARGLGVLGFAPASAPIERADVEHFVDVLLILDEATRMGITVDSADTEAAWARMLARVGSEATLERWLDGHAIDRDWARRLVEMDVLRLRFFDERFAAIVFVDEEQIDREVGPGQHDEAARAHARERLTRATADRLQAEWLEAARRQAAIRLLIPDGAAIPPPFPLP
ncbi:MAG TPA: hypothetical protein VIE37_18195 [Methylomirabilota bacterium]|jgi:hypothetical protein